MRLHLAKLQNNPSLVIGAVVLAFIGIVAVLGPLVSPYDPVAQTLDRRLLPPAWISRGSWSHPLGTDGFGRDVLTRLVYGARISLTVGTGAVVLSGVVGTVAGLTAGYWGGWAEATIMRLSDAQQALPAVLLAIMTVAVLGASVVNLIVVLTLASWFVYARVVFASTVVLRNREFVEAALAIGATSGRILFRHILPNVTGQLLVISALQAGRVMLLEAGLSFLGLGVPDPAPSWGASLAEGRTFLLLSPWPALIPGLAVMVTVWSVNLLGEGLRRTHE